MIRVLTGGQTGVDTGALLACEDRGVLWQAILPRGLRREQATPDWMIKGGVYGRPAIVLRRADYGARTEYTMTHSNGILLIVQPSGLRSPGSKLTHRLAEASGKPYRYHNPAADNFADTLTWLRRYDDGADFTLMVAGPRESRWPGATARSRELVGQWFSLLRETSERTPQPTS